MDLKTLSNLCEICISHVTVRGLPFSQSPSPFTHTHTSVLPWDRCHSRYEVRIALVARERGRRQVGNGEQSPTVWWVAGGQVCLQHVNVNISLDHILSLTGYLRAWTSCLDFKYSYLIGQNRIRVNVPLLWIMLYTPPSLDKASSWLVTGWVAMATRRGSWEAYKTEHKQEVSAFGD